MTEIKIKRYNYTPSKRRINSIKKQKSYDWKPLFLDLTNNKMWNINKLMNILILLLVILLIVAFYKSNQVHAYNDSTRVWHYSEIQWGKYKQPIIVYNSQVEEMIGRWYSLTRILDLLTIRTLECNRYDWKCMNGTSDIWPFQINRIAHKEAYLKSNYLFYNSSELFKYQLTYANDMVEWFMRDYCDWKWSWDNKTRFKCVAISYNGNKNIASNWKQVRHNYADLWWEKRKRISNYIVKTYPNLKN